jgi:hypothetical protein
MSTTFPTDHEDYDVTKALAEAFRIQGWMSEFELRWLAERAAGSNIVIEVGAWKGRTTKVLALARHVVYAVDHWKGCPGVSVVMDEVMKRGSDALFCEFLENLDFEIRAGKVVSIPNESEKAAEIVSGILGKIGCLADMLFIDGDHAYESVKRDIRLWTPLVKPGGLICGHDYDHADWPGVVRAVDEIFKKDHAQVSTIWFTIKP